MKPRKPRVTLSVYGIRKRLCSPLPGKKPYQEHNQKRNQEIRALCEKGESVEEIARAYALKVRTIEMLCSGVRRPTLLAKQERRECNQKITRRYIAGESLSSLGKAFGMTPSGIWRITAAEGAPRHYSRGNLERHKIGGKQTPKREKALTFCGGMARRGWPVLMCLPRAFSPPAQTTTPAKQEGECNVVQDQGE